MSDYEKMGDCDLRFEISKQIGTLDGWACSHPEVIAVLREAAKRLQGSGWVSHPPMAQGWFWAIPRFPEDALPEVICVWQDDGEWSFGEQGRPRSYYRKFSGPIAPPKEDGP